MDVQKAWNRGNNLVATAVLTLAGFAFLPEAIIEDEHIHKADDVLLFIVGVIALIWYKTGNHRYVRSSVPVLLTCTALLIKLGGVILEFKDKEDVGDDFGGLILFVLATSLVFWLYRRKTKTPAS